MIPRMMFGLYILLLGEALKRRNAAAAEVKSTIPAASLPSSVHYIAGRRLPYKRPFFVVPLHPHEIEQDLALMTNVRRTRNTRGGQRLGTASPKDMSACTIVLLRLRNHRLGKQFNHPVSKCEWPPDAVDSYRKLVKTPSDLSSIQARLSCGEYTHPVIFADDVRSVFRNAALCARADSDLQRTALELWSIFEEDVVLYQIAAVEPVVVPGSSVVGVDKAEVADAGDCQPLKALTDVCKYEEEKSKTISLHTPVTRAQILKAVYLPVADGLILATGRPRSRSNSRRRCMSLKQGHFCRHSAYSPSHGFASISKAQAAESEGACTDHSRRSHPSTPADTCRIHSPQAGCARVRVHTVCQPLPGPVGDLTEKVCKAGSSTDCCDFDRTSCARTNVMYSHSMREVGGSSGEILKAIFVQTTSLLAAPSTVPSIAESPTPGCPSQEQEPADRAEIEAKHSGGCCGEGGMAQARSGGRPDQAGALRVGGKSSMGRLFQRVTYNLGGSSCEPLKNGGQGPILLDALSKALDMAPMQKAEQPLRVLQLASTPQAQPAERGRSQVLCGPAAAAQMTTALEIQVKPWQQQVDGGDGDVAESDASFGKISQLLHIYGSHLGGVIEEAVKEPLNGRFK
eukprot:SM000010S04362  [mRNA]  locus=s10:1127577:1137296:- [translate_table: standard]